MKRNKESGELDGPFVKERNRSMTIRVVLPPYFSLLLCKLSTCICIYMYSFIFACRPIIPRAGKVSPVPFFLLPGFLSARPLLLFYSSFFCSSILFELKS